MRCLHDTDRGWFTGIASRRMEVDPPAPEEELLVYRPDQDLEESLTRIKLNTRTPLKQQAVNLPTVTPPKVMPKVPAPEKRFNNPLAGGKQSSDEDQSPPSTVRRLGPPTQKAIDKKARGRARRRQHEAEKRRIAVHEATAEHFRLQSTSATSYGEAALNEVIGKCNSLRNCNDFLPKGFEVEGRYVNKDSNKKNIASLAALQKKRKLIKEGRFNLIEKTCIELKKDGPIEAEDDELLLWYINKDKETEDKEFKAAQALVNRRTGQDESSENDDDKAFESDETDAN